jgi:peptidoglycan/LPS O-acetylase OafA/YrhL
MNSRTTKHIAYLDGWRGFAIACLLVGHFFPVRGINLGAIGVDLFFVLSGFLMARLLFINTVPLPLFYKRRASRIFPAMFFFLAAIVIAYLTLGWPIDWPEVVSAALFVKNYFPGQPGAAVMPFGHIWSLCVEEHSYIVLSVVACGVRARWFTAKSAIGALTILLALAGVGYWLTYRGSHLVLDRWIRSEVSAFGIFASAFLLLVFHGRKMPPLPLPVLPFLVGFGFAMHWWSIPAPVQTILGMGAFALAVNFLKQAPPLLHRVLSFMPLRQLGLWSFSIYLWQQPFYLYVHRNGMSPWLGVGLSILAGIVSFYCLESPVRSYLNRVTAKPRAGVLDQSVVQATQSN